MANIKAITVQLAHDHADELKTTADGLAIGITIGTVLGWLPHIAALLTIAWTAIRIWETDTVQRWLGRTKTVTVTTTAVMNPAVVETIKQEVKDGMEGRL